MVVLQPMKLGTSRVGFNLRRGRARRALSLLGDNNSKLNLQLAQSLLTISAEEFTKKWNFDPISDVPLRSGRYQWTSTAPARAAAAAVAAAAASRDPDAAEDVAHGHGRSCSFVSATDPPPPADDPPRDTCVTQGAAPAANICGTAAVGDDGHHLCRLRTSCGSDTIEQHNPDGPASERESQRPGTVQADDHHGVENNPQSLGNDNQATENVTQIDDDSRVLEEAAAGSPAETEAAVAAAAAAPLECGGGSSSSSSDEAERPATAELHDVPRNDPQTHLRDDPNTTTFRQTCITEYVRPRKRSAVMGGREQPTLSKKRPASSLQDHIHHQPPHKKVLLQLRA